PPRRGRALGWIPEGKNPLRLSRAVAGAFRASRRVGQARSLALGVARCLDGRDPQRDPRGARLRAVRGGGTAAHPRPTRLPRGRFLDTQEVSQSSSRTRARNRWGHRPPVCAIWPVQGSCSMAGDDRGLARTHYAFLTLLIF